MVVDGAVVVTTPQRLAVQEAEKAVEMFRKLDVPVLGVVENMSYGSATAGAGRTRSAGGAAPRWPSASGVPLLAELPFEEPVVEGEDRGAPPVLEHPESAVARAFRSLAEGVVTGLGFMRAGAGEADAASS